MLLIEYATLVAGVAQKKTESSVNVAFKLMIARIAEWVIWHYDEISTYIVTQMKYSGV